MTRWITRIICIAALVVSIWVLATAWSAVVHGHPLYAVMLALTLAVGAAVLLLSFRAPREGRPPRSWLRWILWSLGVVFALGWIAVIAWLKPFNAQEPALTAMKSEAGVTVTETPTAIVMSPAQGQPTTGVLFQPGARVDARAYAALLRPVAEAGDLVVIPKQPIGVAFLSAGALGTARAAHPEITNWIVGGHSLGGTVSAGTALADADANATAPVSGLLLYASYPSGDAKAIKAEVMSISGSQDGLATPADIEASRANLPASTQFVVIDGAPHAYFGDYGDQPGDGVATVDRATAQSQITDNTLTFVRAAGQ